MDENIVYYPLTHPQKGIWYMEKLYPGTSIGNIAATLRIKNDVDYDLLEQAINLFIQNNDATRLKFIEDNGQPLQFISEYHFRKLEFFDFSNKSQNEFFQWEEEQARIPFQLLKSDLTYFSLVKINENDGGFFVKMHHLTSDAWSMSLVGNKIIDFYSYLKNGKEYPKGNTHSYIDYVKSEEEYINSERYVKDQKYWYEKFNNLPELTTLKPRLSKKNNTNTKRKTFILPKKFTLKMYEFCKEYNVSVPAIFIAGLSLYINRVTRTEDIVVGTMVLNRSNHKEKNIAGMFISTIPLRIRIHEKMNFLSFINEFSKEWVTNLKHQKYPYEKIQKEVREKNNFNENLYDIVISYQNAKFNRHQQMEDYETRWLFNGHQTESLAIHINDRDEDGFLILDYDYLVDLFYTKEIEFLHEHIIRILWHALDDPYRSISLLEMISENERHKILYEFNNTYVDFPKDKTINQLFEEQVNINPEKTAVIFEENSITYFELNAKANQLARLLRLNGVKNNTIVGIALNRSIDMMVGIIGILKAGGAYLPIDPDYPADRINHMLQDSNLSILLTHSDLSNRFKSESNIIEIDKCDLSIFESINIDNIVKPENLAYIIYTSGSTGKPKGVMIAHSSYVNATFAWRKEYKLDELDVRLLQIASFSFDVFAGDLSRALLNGGTMIMCSVFEQYNPVKLAFLINRYNITIFESTPALIIPLMKYIYENNLNIDSLKMLIIGSDICPLNEYKLIVQRFGTGVRIINSYGVTEATIDSSYYEEPHNKIVLNGNTPIGKPMSNVKMLILNNNLQIQPIGIYGELFISGMGLAKGYLNKPELTNEKFILNPYAQNEYMYRTGDLVRWTAQGNIEFFGRIDDQVKIHGFRVELEEITKCILELENVDDAVVVAKTLDNGQKYLCAYVKTSFDFNINEIKNYLQKKLPNYMIPAFLIKMNDFPLTPNGKINRNFLPDPDKSTIQTKYKAPRNEIDKILASVFNEVLNLKMIGIDDNFFDLGGDSLAIIQIQIKLFSNKINITTQDIYECPTIRQLSDKIRGVEIIKSSGYEKSHYIFDQYNDNNAGSSNLLLPNDIVLLTGATGFLGAHLLDELLSGKKTVCCLVRGKDEFDSKDRLINILDFYFPNKYKNVFGKSLFVINGDITKNNLGLNDDLYLDLCSKICTIIHAAALVKHYGDYENFHRINVIGTKEVIRLAEKAEKTLNFISTTSLYDEDLQNSNNNYIKSKIEAEYYINANIKRGLKALILRVGNLTGRYSDGFFQKNINDNAFYRALQSICHLKAVSFGMLKLKYDFTPVDYASKAIMVITEKNGLAQGTCDIINNNLITIESLVISLNKMGINVKILPDSKYKKLLELASLDKSKQKFLEGIINKIIETEYFTKQNVDVAECRDTYNYLNKLGFKWPLIDDDYIARIINHINEFASEKFILIKT